MRTARWIAPLLLVVVGVGAVIAADTTPQAPKPGPEHERLQRFTGKWTGKGELKPGPFGPGGQMTWTETAEWFPGGFHVIAKSDGDGPMGPSKGLSILGYNSEEKVYTFYGVDSMGWADYAKGTIQGKLWTFTSESKMGGKTYHSRFTIDEVSDSKNKFKWDLSEDGKTWTTMMEGESTK
jgi:hypothetical protein